MQKELELKFELSESEVYMLGRELAAGDIESAQGASAEVRSTYFDTPEYALRAAGISLRLRQQDGGWLQTVKVEQHVVDGLSNPVELEARTEIDKPDIGCIPDRSVKRTIRKAVKGSLLKPVFETIVQRTTWKIKCRDSEIELAVDDGEVRARSARREVREAELELKSGSTAGLLITAEKLFANRQFELGTRSKAERGYRLALGMKGTCTQPKKAVPSPAGPDSTCAEAFSAILISAADQIIVNRRAVLETEDPEGAHQLRVGLRRLRSALRGLRPLVDRDTLNAFERSARDMDRTVGGLRDADVLISDVAAPMEAAARDKTGFAELSEILARSREAKREEVRSALRGPDWTRLHLYLVLWPRTLHENRAMDRGVRKHARKILRKEWKKTARYGHKLDTLDGAGRHEMRKSLKKLRYQAEFFSTAFAGRKAERFIKQLKSLQKVFGYVNDVRLAPQVVALEKEHQAGIEAARAASYTFGRHEAEAVHAWGHAGESWKALKVAPRFWE